MIIAEKVKYTEARNIHNNDAYVLFAKAQFFLEAQSFETLQLWTFFKLLKQTNKPDLRTKTSN